MHDCANFAAETAEAFKQIFDLGGIYGAVILGVGLVAGYGFGRWSHA